MRELAVIGWIQIKVVLVGECVETPQAWSYANKTYTGYILIPHTNTNLAYGVDTKLIIDRPIFSFQDTIPSHICGRIASLLAYEPVPGPVTMAEEAMATVN